MPDVIREKSPYAPWLEYVYREPFGGLGGAHTVWPLEGSGSMPESNLYAQYNGTPNAYYGYNTTERREWVYCTVEFNESDSVHRETINLVLEVAGVEIERSVIDEWWENTLADDLSLKRLGLK